MPQNRPRPPHNKIRLARLPDLLRLLSILLFAFCTSLLPCHASQEFPQEPGQGAIPATQTEQTEFSARRDFRSLVRRDMAERAARLDAELQAFEQAARILARHPDLQFVGGTGPDGKQSSSIPLDGLALALFSTTTSAVGAEGFPPYLKAVVQLRLVSPDNLRNAIQNALLRPDSLELYAAVLANQRLLLQSYDALADALLSLRHPTDGGKEEMHRLQSIIHEIKALEVYLALLPTYGQSWSAPHQVSDTLTRAKELSPKNPLILAGLAEALLQLDRPVQALDNVSQAIALNPDFARAYDIKGAALLRQRLPALAAESFGRAIALAPHNPAYHLHRASAYLVQEEEQGMCSDFQQACGLGNCEGLQWAKRLGRCMGDAP